MKLSAIILFLLIAFFADWGDAFFFLGGYLFAFLIAGTMKAKGEL